MKIKNSLFTFIALFVLIACIACKKHSCSYSKEWNSDDNYHWHSCDCGSKSENGEHSFDSGVVTVEPTQTTVGTKLFTCTICGFTKTEEIAMVGHQHTWVDATCETPKMCSSCKITEGQSLGHVEVIDSAVEATCSSTGLTAGSHCSRCEEVIIEQKVIKALEHIWDEGQVTLEPTELTEGVKKFTCSVCQTVKNESIAVLNHTHTFGTDYGYDEKFHWIVATCAHTDLKANKELHTWDEGEVTIPATENETGAKVFNCMCGGSYTEIIPATGHIHKYDTVLSSNLTHHWYASTCGHDVYFEKTPHSWNEGVVGAVNTTYTCSDCNETMVVANNSVLVNFITSDTTLAETTTILLNKDELIKIDAISSDGYVPFNDYINFASTLEKGLYINFYYSEIDLWDGITISESLIGTGSEEDPFLIQCGADLAYLSAQVNAGNTYAGSYFKLTRSIDLSNKVNFMIGKSATNSFAGVFDGNNCSIRGFNIERTSSRSGLFYDLLAGGEIKNLSVYGLISGGQYTGSIAGNVYGTITNCHNYAEIIVSNDANGQGGIAGGINDLGAIINCYNYGNVSGNLHTGGIVGVSWTSTSKVSNCKNFGSVTSSANDTKGGAGGIIGTQNGTVESCSNYGSVNGITYVGGLSGLMKGSIANSINNAKVSGTKYVGGLAGNVSSTLTITNSINNGEINSSSYITGGLAGAVKSCEVIDCTNNGDVISTADCVGGLVGVADSGSKITNCINNGNVLVWRIALFILMLVQLQIV